MNILVTGGAGFVGTNLCLTLAEQGHTVTVVDNFSTGHEDGIKNVVASILAAEVQSDSWHGALKGQDAVVHLAAQTSVPASVEDPAFDADVNVMGTLRTLKAAVDAGVPRFVFASSAAAVGMQPGRVDETVVPHPISPYGASKLAGEAYCQTFADIHGIQAVSLRFANVYGPHSAFHSSAIAIFQRVLADGKPIPIFGDGLQTRDFVYVGDICQAIDLAMTTDGIAGEIFQVGSGESITVLDLVDAIGKVVGRSLEVEHLPERAGDIRHSSFDISKAREVLGFEPRTSLEEGLREALRDAI